MSDSQIEAGGAPLVEPNTYNPIFSTSMPLGTPVAVSATEADTVIPANASAIGTTQAFGLVIRNANGGSRGGVRYQGVLTLGGGLWADVLDTGTELTQGVPYYVSPTVGKITKTAPSSESQFICPIGYALSTDSLMIQPGLAQVA